MPQGFSRIARVAMLAQFGMLAFAFQSEGPIEIVPRAAPKAAAPVMRVASSLVLIPVHVTTAGGASVTDLKKEDFELYEDGVKQTITHFAQDDAPVSAGVLLDVSGSMRNKMAKASEAATEFFKFANAEDEFFLLEFNARPRLSVPFTRDWPGIASAIAAVKPSGMTAMLDAIHLADEARPSHAQGVGGDLRWRRQLQPPQSPRIERYADRSRCPGLFTGSVRPRLLCQTHT
jgi:Ca-activated chloride channel family protein